MPSNMPSNMPGDASKTLTYEIHHPKTGRCIGYLSAEDSETARIMQDSGFIVIQEVI